MKKESTNSFEGGLVYDLNPVVTPNNVLTDNINGTFLTFNADELALQNDAGNTTISIVDSQASEYVEGQNYGLGVNVYTVESGVYKYYKHLTTSNANGLNTTDWVELVVKLSDGFHPIGIKEYGGILYIVSAKYPTITPMKYGVEFNTSNEDAPPPIALQNVYRAGDVIYVTEYGVQIYYVCLTDILFPPTNYLDIINYLSYIGTYNDFVNKYGKIEFGSYPAPLVVNPELIDTSVFYNLTNDGTPATDFLLQLYNPKIINNTNYQGGSYITFDLGNNELVNLSYPSYTDLSFRENTRLFFKTKLYHKLSNGFLDLTDNVWTKYSQYYYAINGAGLNDMAPLDTPLYWFSDPTFKYFCPNNYKGKLAISTELEHLDEFVMNPLEIVTNGNQYDVTFSFSITNTSSWFKDSGGNYGSMSVMMDYSLNGDDTIGNVNVVNTLKAIVGFGASGGATKVTSNSHGLPAGSTNIIITGTTHYNGIFAATKVDDNSFTIPITFDVDDATGSWRLENPLVVSGIYLWNTAATIRVETTSLTEFSWKVVGDTNWEETALFADGALQLVSDFSSLGITIDFTDGYTPVVGDYWTFDLTPAAYGNLTAPDFTSSNREMEILLNQNGDFYEFTKSFPLQVGFLQTVSFKIFPTFTAYQIGVGTTTYNEAPITTFPQKFIDAHLIKGSFLLTDISADYEFVVNQWGCVIGEGYEEANYLILQNSNGDYIDFSGVVNANPHYLQLLGTTRTAPTGGIACGTYQTNNSVYPVNIVVTASTNISSYLEHLASSTIVKRTSLECSGLVKLSIYTNRKHYPTCPIYVSHGVDLQPLIFVDWEANLFEFEVLKDTPFIIGIISAPGYSDAYDTNLYYESAAGISENEVLHFALVTKLNGYLRTAPGTGVKYIEFNLPFTYESFGEPIHYRDVDNSTLCPPIADEDAFWGDIANWESFSSYGFFESAPCISVTNPPINPDDPTPSKKYSCMVGYPYSAYRGIAWVNTNDSTVPVVEIKFSYGLINNDDYCNLIGNLHIFAMRGSNHIFYTNGGETPKIPMTFNEITTRI